MLPELQDDKTVKYILLSVVFFSRSFEQQSFSALTPYYATIFCPYTLLRNIPFIFRSQCSDFLKELQNKPGGQDPFSGMPITPPLFGGCLCFLSEMEEISTSHKHKLVLIFVYNLLSFLRNGGEVLRYSVLKRLIPLDECGEYFPVHLFPPLPLHNS